MDDQRADHLLADGPQSFPAPHLRQLAAAGTSFSNTFVNTPICTPARAEILTGCNSFQNGVRWFRQPINPHLQLLPEHFREHGYHTIFSGKWHNDGHPSERGFLRTRRVFPSDNLLQPDYETHGHTMRFSEGDETVEGHSTELFTEAAIQEIREAPGDQPWFCQIAYHSPHDPFDCPEPFASSHPVSEVPLPDDYFPMPPYDNGDLAIRDELLLPWPRTQGDIREYRARYWRMIAHHDHCIGTLLDFLDREGHRENTVVVFTSDHGLAVGSHGLLGKENLYDHSCRVPWILAGQGIPVGRNVTGLAANTDIYPTLCELCDLPVPETVADGRSLAPCLRDGRDTGRDFVVCSFGSPGTGGDPKSWRETQRSIRTTQWKLVCDLWSGRHQLYDLQKDGLETVNLLEPWIRKPDSRFGYHPSHDPLEIQKIVDALLDTLHEWQRQNKDPALNLIPDKISLY